MLQYLSRGTGRESMIAGRSVHGIDWDRPLPQLEPC